MKITIPRCYDSHVHFLGTGQFLKGLNLKGLKSIEELKSISLKPEYFKGEWLVGFGWDQHLFSNQAWPTRFDLDKVYPAIPVLFSRVDGHASWLNSCAIEKLEQNGTLEKIRQKYPSQILEQTNGDISGILIESAKVVVDLSLPEYSQDQFVEFFRAANSSFTRNGFTHVRDMTGTLQQWNILRLMENRNELSVFVEMNFVAEDKADFQRALNEINIARKHETTHLRTAGIKFFLDGSLGSEGALLSTNYSNGNQSGILLWKLLELKQCIAETWLSGFPVSIHCIGDQSAHEVALMAFELVKAGHFGALHIEHGEIIRQETISIFHQLSQMGCDLHFHMQPCHFLSDQSWLKQKVANLYLDCFPWARLQGANLKIHWGSDSPIEEASVAANLKALKLAAANGIQSIAGDPWLPHSHPDPNWGPGSFSDFEI